jgi:hypothetical protein
VSRQTPQANPARAPRSARSKKAGRTARSAPSPSLDVPPKSEAPRRDADVEAQRALLADPARIAQGPSPGHATKPRTRTVAEAKPTPSASPLPSPTKKKPSPRHAPKTEPDPTPEPTPQRSNRSTALLDATRAQRLAREARLRQHESREALARTRAALATPILPEPTPELPATTAPGWHRRPLGQPILAGTPTPAAPRQASTPSIAPRAALIPPAERALAAELREAKATLAIARETTVSQRDEIARLRAALADAATSAVDVPANASAPNEDERAERIELRGRISVLEAELERAALERAELHRAMAAHQQELAERSRRQAALQERYDVLEQALDQTRRQAEQERRRHTEAQTLLERLRATLRGVGTDPHEAAPAAAIAVALPAPSPAAPASSAPASGAATLLVATAPVAAAATSSSPGPTAPARAVPTARGAGARAPIFSFWLEEQVRRNFGPLGIDSIPDLLREPLARRGRANDGALRILLVGPGVAGQARDLCEALVRAGTPAFELHVADPDARRELAPLGDDPLREMIRRGGHPDRPETLRERLRELEPAVVVTRELLTWQADVAPWLDVLQEASAAGTALVLLEQTGLGAVTPSAELGAIGERIWELLPERYTRDPESGSKVSSFREAFAARATPPPNGLLRRLREGFELELCAQFGFLAEAFVSGPIASCFDEQQPRDQRFLKQIADVDERRLESGQAAALHLVARIDPAGSR